MQITEFQNRFNPVLKAVLQKHLQPYNALLPEAELQQLVHHAQTIALAGGKRLRPYLAMIMSGTSDLSEPQMHILCALEVFHLFALVHDDIIDQATERHGTATIQCKADMLYPHHTGAARAQAMLAGDALLSIAHALWRNASAAHPRAYDSFCAMVHEVIAGQMIDVHLTTLSCDHGALEVLIQQKNLLKTASYTFIRPMQIGTMLRFATEPWLRFCTELGTLLGAAFQVQDDLLDITGNPHHTGKPVLRDLAEGQHTIFSHFVWQHGSPDEKKQLHAAFGSPIDPTAVADIQRMFQNSGALHYGQKIIASAYDQAETLLQTIRLDQTIFRPLTELLHVLRERTG